MADPLKQMCEELGVCKEEALFYLEGFRWDLNAATEACRSKTLPSLAADQPPSSENERVAAAEETKRNEKIASFLTVSIGASAEDAVKYLSDYNWNLDYAARSFHADRHDDTEKTPEPVVPSSHDFRTESWYLNGFSGDARSDLMQEVLSNVPQFDFPSAAASTPPFEPTQESIKQFSDFVTEASSKAVIDCLKDCKGIVEAAVRYFYDVYSIKYPTEILSDDTKEERIASFASMTGATIQVAKVYLEKYMWNLDVATNSFFDGTASSQATLPSIGLLPSQSQFESSGPTETQRSLEGDVAVAIPGVASSQVDGGSSTETVPDPFANRDRTQTAPSTIVMTITLADMRETLLELSFRSDQTVRHIHNAIDLRYPDHDRGYVLQSMDGVDYKDWNLTVDRVCAGDSTFLLQVYP